MDVFLQNCNIASQFAPPPVKNAIFDIAVAGCSCPGKKGAEFFEKLICS